MFRQTLCGGEGELNVRTETQDMAEEPTTKDYLSLLLIIGVIVGGFIGFNLLTNSSPLGNGGVDTNAVVTAEPDSELDSPQTFQVTSEDSCKDIYRNKSGSMEVIQSKVDVEWETWNNRLKVEDAIGGKEVRFCRWTEFDSYQTSESFEVRVFNNTAEIEKSKGARTEPPFLLRIVEYKDGRLVKQLPWKVNVSRVQASK
jgi:hypothetical protein